VAAGFELHTVWDRGSSGLFNDFFDYWAAGRVLLHGGNPYDATALSQALSAAGVHSTVGEFGYSYPLFFLLLVVPLALLPAHVLRRHAPVPQVGRALLRRGRVMLAGLIDPEPVCLEIGGDGDLREADFVVDAKACDDLGG